MRTSIAAITQALVLVAGLSLGACSPQPIGDADILCVDQGKHPFEPAARHWWTNNSTLAYAYQFGEEVAYDLHSDNQCDYNKIGGLSADLFTNHENSLMVGWRYDLSGQLVLAPYYHQDGTAYYASAPCTGYTADLAVEDPALEYLSIPATEQYEVFWRVINPTTVSVLILTSQENLYYEHVFPNANFSHWREIAPYFGGDEPAPHEICLLRYKIGSSE